MLNCFAPQVYLNPAFAVGGLTYLRALTLPCCCLQKRKVGMEMLLASATS